MIMKDIPIIIYQGEPNHIIMCKVACAAKMIAHKSCFTDISGAKNAFTKKGTYNFDP